MPFGSYEISPEQALTNAYRFLKECGMDAVKLEGGRERAATVAKIVQGGVAVMALPDLTHSPGSTHSNVSGISSA